MERHVSQYSPNYDDGESVLTMLYECHNKNNPYDNEQIKEDFNELYQQMNGMPLREIDKIIILRDINHKRRKNIAVECDSRVLSPFCPVGAASMIAKTAQRVFLQRWKKRTQFAFCSHLKADTA